MDPVRSVRVSTVVPARIDDPKVGDDDDVGDGDDNDVNSDVGGVDGNNIYLGTLIPMALSKHFMAAPMAVTSWYALVFSVAKVT